MVVVRPKCRALQPEARGERLFRVRTERFEELVRPRKYKDDVPVLGIDAS